MEFKSTFLAVSTLLQIISVQSSSITFCDGPNKIEKSREQCGSGYNFGNPKPDCVCIKGIYRIWTDTCEVADGFADEICTKLTDDKTKSNIVGLKLSNDPVNWNQTGVVCDRKGFGGDVGWGFVSSDSRATSTSSDHVYVLNGQAFISSTGGICVKHAKLQENKKICKYLKKDNKVMWKRADIEVSVSQHCDGKPMQSTACFGVLQASSSECRLSCNTPHGRSFRRPQPPAPAQQPGRIQGRTMQTPKGKPPPPKPGQRGPIQADYVDGLTNITNPADYRQHDNKFLNRKMLIFNVINQLEEGNHTNASWSKSPAVYGQPVKTFELFDIMKNIVKTSCPSQYVNPDWIDMTIDLFYILHKGHVFRYDELVTQEQYEWIRDILTKCLGSLNGTDPSVTTTVPSPVPITGTDTSSSFFTSKCGSASGGQATGYCDPGTVFVQDLGGQDSTLAEEPCVFVPVSVKSDRANSSFHYVPDVAWDIVDMIQVQCFPQFNESYRMFHVLEQAAEKLFTLQIKNLWYYPGWSPKTKTKLLGAGSDIQMHNLEVCVESAYAINGKIPRLVRPPPPKYIRKRRSVGSQSTASLSKTSEAYCVRSQGDFVYPRNCKA